jgi:hypothetical protein
MNVDFLVPARREMDDAFKWYETQTPGLGYEFLDEIDHVVHRVTVFPSGAPEIERGLRRVLVNRFPYGLVYGQTERRIVVVAVAHLHREPRYWIDRMASDKED